VRWFIFAAIMVGFGLYTIHDHYVQGNYAKPQPYALNAHLKYLFNHYVPYLVIPIGLIAAGLGIRHLTRRLVADEEGIGYIGEDRVPWSQIAKVDATALRKGFLHLHHGQDGKLTLDSWKLRNFKDLVSLIERSVPADRIVR